jgi:hypothetical protein
MRKPIFWPPNPVTTHDGFSKKTKQQKQPEYKIPSPLLKNQVQENDAYLATSNEKSSKLFLCNLFQNATYKLQRLISDLLNTR